MRFFQTLLTNCCCARPDGDCIPGLPSLYILGDDSFAFLSKSADFSGTDPAPAEFLGRTWLRPAATVRRGSWRGHHGAGDIPARAGPKPYSVGYVQPSRRPADGRYGENPNRLFKHMQYQVILKPPPENVQELYLESLKAIGIDLRKHDIKFEEDNWESPTLGAWGIGWQVMLDGLEITQFTYFQQCGGMDLDPISAELTYGLERIAAFLQDVDSIYDIMWVVDPDGRPVKYGEMRLAG